MTPERAGRAARWGVAAAVLWVAACGGGGGDGGGAGNPAGPVTTGLVPAAMPLGAVLYGDARTLRPMGAGSRWIYHSHDYTSGNVRQTTVRHAAHALGGVAETGPDGDITQITVDASGNIRMSTTLDLGNGGAPLTIAGIELGAVIRVNDQHVLIDQRVQNLGADLDNDGKPDGIDIAGWNVVVGNETVTLPNASITALRVDTYASARAVLSSGAAAATVTLRVSTWYAPDIGVVRVATSGSGASQPLDDDNVLLGYDGIATGWGYTMLDAVPVIGASPVAGRVIQLADGVLLDNGQDIYRLDRRGVTVSKATFAPGGVVPTGYGFVRLATGVRKITGSFPDWAIHSLADDGTLLSGDTPTPVDLRGRAGQSAVDVGERIVSFPGADRFWAAWRRTYSAGPSTQGQEVVLRWIDGNGNLAPAETRLPIATAGVTDFQVVARANDIVVSWIEVNTSSVATLRLVRLDVSGAVVSDSSTDVSVTASGFATRQVLPLADDSRLWVGWQGPTATSTTAVAHALRLDDAGLPMGTGADPASLLAATVDALHPEVASAWPINAMADNGTWLVQGSGFGLMFPDDTLTRNWLTYAEYLPGNGAVTGAQVQETRRFRIPANQVAVPVFAFDDRVLLLTTEQGFFRPTVIWGR